MKRALPIALIVIVAASVCLAQFQGRGRGRRGGPPPSDGDYTIRDRRGVPDWEMNKQFSKDVFTFVRIRYVSRYDSWRRGKWETDRPDSDLNFSFRLQQLTSLKVNPEPVVLELTDPELFDYPFIYVCEPGDMVLSNEEVVALRRYLLNGGFMMVDDFWSDYEYDNFAEQFAKVFPNKTPQELPFEHEIFNCVYPLKEKLEKRPQIPSINVALHGRDYGITWERPGCEEVHYKGVFDDDGRMMAIICHNTDLGDGWEREGMSEWYFREFSEKKAYPLGINIVTYAMTH